MSKYLTALLLALATVSGFSHAAQPGDGDKALFISDLAGNNQTYNVGIFLSDKTIDRKSVV